MVNKPVVDRSTATETDRWIGRMNDARADLSEHRARHSTYRSVLTEQGIARCVTLMEEIVDTARDECSTRRGDWSIEPGSD